MGSISHCGTRRSMPGSAIGTAVSALISPALPKEVPPAGGNGSTTSTLSPARCR